MNHYPRLEGEQSGANLKVVMRAFFEIIRLWWRMRSYVPPSGVVIEKPPTYRGYALFGIAGVIGLLFLRGVVAAPFSRGKSLHKSQRGTSTVSTSNMVETVSI